MTEPRSTWGEWLEQTGARNLISLSEEQARMIWQPTRADREAAWILYTELRTRIATQPLHFRSGDEETALKSLRALFALTRKTIEDKGPECHHFATIAIQVLNVHIRPLTAKWHKKLIAGRLQHDDHRRDFRRDLRALQPGLSAFCRLLERMAEADAEQEDTSRGPSPQRSEDAPPVTPEGTATVGPAIPFEAILFDSSVDSGGIYQAELAAIRERRAGTEPIGDLVGLACSGGGIRSATLCLGVAQVLAKRGILARVDYLSTVSGGGYFGAFLSSYLNDDDPNVGLEPGKLPFAEPGKPEPSPIRRLRNSSKYLLAGGLLGQARMVGLMLLGMLINLFTLLPVLLLALAAAKAAVLFGITSTVLLVLSAVLLLGLPFVYRRHITNREQTSRYERLAIGVAVAALLFCLLASALPWLHSSLAPAIGSPSDILVLVGLAIGLAAWSMTFNANWISPHRYYRNRLADTYLLRRGKPSIVDPQRLSSLRSANPRAPYHLINAAVNLPGSEEPELRGRFSDFFLFSQHYCGSPLLGYRRTRELEEKDPGLDLGTAMAISGAAASSYMGTGTIRGLVFLLALLNVRLGYWLPNPKKLDEIRAGSGARPFSLWRELLGKLDENGRFVNLSDGGHIENLGIYELLRRRCKLVIAIDGEADPQMHFTSLMRLIRYARIDFGIAIELDLDDLRPNEQGYVKAHVSLGEIHYPGGLTGYLLYIKSSLTGNERDDILDYRRAHPSFPHESTADQFFSEAQFEAYRALGEHIASDLFREELVGQPDRHGRFDLHSWLRALVDNLFEEPIRPPATTRDHQ